MKMKMKFLQSQKIRNNLLNKKNLPLLYNRIRADWIKQERLTTVKSELRLYLRVVLF